MRTAGAAIRRDASRVAGGRGRRRRPAAPRGFTLIELLITVVIVALLASAALPLTELTVKRLKEHELRTALWQIRTAIDAYKDAADRGKVAKAADESGYPKTLESLADGAPNIKDPKLARIYFLRRVPRNPFWTDAGTPAAGTWGKRSYASPPDNPVEGPDVYDVYVPSSDVGLNGVPYRDW
jgi:general secretion pathway protein G